MNDAGPGEPSDSSAGIVAKPEKGTDRSGRTLNTVALFALEKPSFDLSGLFGPLGKKEIRIKAGEPLTIDLPIKGSPRPIVTWKIGRAHV